MLGCQGLIVLGAKHAAEWPSETVIMNKMKATNAENTVLHLGILLLTHVFRLYCSSF